jgi:hypothetical protein
MKSQSDCSSAAVKARRKPRPKTPYDLTLQQYIREPPRGLNEGLCQRCRSIDFEAICSINLDGFHDWDAKLILDLGDEISTECQLCQVFWHCANMQIGTGPNVSTVHLPHVRAWAGRSMMTPEPAPSVPLYVTTGQRLPGHGSIFDPGRIVCWPRRDSSGEASGRPALDARSINYGFLATQIQACTETNGETIGKVESVARMKLIDCNTRRIVSAPSGADYVALSYVWVCINGQSDKTATPR